MEKTQEQAWNDESPYETYRAACRRMELATTACDHELRRRWPTLGDCNRAMVAAYEAITDEQRRQEDDTARRDLAFEAIVEANTQADTFWEDQQKPAARLQIVFDFDRLIGALYDEGAIDKPTWESAHRLANVVERASRRV